MNDDFVKKLQNGGVDIYGDNGELMTRASPEILTDFLNATNARHFSHHFNPGARGNTPPQAQQAVNKTEPDNTPAWEAAEGHYYGDNHELVAILPAKLKL